MHPTPPNPHPVDRFLEWSGIPDSNEELRLELFKQTTRRLRRQRHLRQVALIASLVVCYVAGLVTAGFWFQGSTEVVVPPAMVIPVPDTVSESALDVAKSRSGESVPLEADPDTPALVIERVAELAGVAQRFHLYCRAGDRYLERHADLSSALRCYRLALDAASPRDLNLVETDTWLLMALKRARLEGRTHARPDS